MRSISTPAFPLLTGLSLLAGLVLTGCTAKQKEEIAPKNWCSTGAACGTAATVRLCLGNTTGCPTQHTTLVLADGTRLQPTGPAWEAYQPQQLNGQIIYIGYSATGPTTHGAPADASAILLCLDTTAR